MDVKILGLTWTPRMSQMQGAKKKKVQAFIDSTVMQEIEPFVPKRTGALKRSVITGSVVGSGMLTFAIAYARRQKYLKNRKIVVGKRDSHYFSRMKAQRMGNINRSVKAYVRRLNQDG